MSENTKKLKVPIKMGYDHIQGPVNAPINLVEYGDFECPYTGHAYPIVREIKRKFGETLCFVFRNFPLNEIHPHAQQAAEAAEAPRHGAAQVPRVTDDIWRPHRGYGGAPTGAHRRRRPGPIRGSRAPRRGRGRAGTPRPRPAPAPPVALESMRRGLVRGTAP